MHLLDCILVQPQSTQLLPQQSNSDFGVLDLGPKWGTKGNQVPIKPPKGHSMVRFKAFNTDHPNSSNYWTDWNNQAFTASEFLVPLDQTASVDRLPSASSLNFPGLERWKVERSLAQKVTPQPSPPAVCRPLGQDKLQLTACQRIEAEELIIHIFIYYIYIYIILYIYICS